MDQFNDLIPGEPKIYSCYIQRGLGGLLRPQYERLAIFSADLNGPGLPRLFQQGRKPLPSLRVGVHSHRFTSSTSRPSRRAASTRPRSKPTSPVTPTRHNYMLRSVGQAGTACRAPTSRFAHFSVLPQAARSRPSFRFICVYLCSSTVPEHKAVREGDPGVVSSRFGRYPDRRIPRYQGYTSREEAWPRQAPALFFL